MDYPVDYTLQLLLVAKVRKNRGLDNPVKK